MIATIALLILITIPFLLSVIIERKRRAAVKSRKLDEVLFRRDGKDEET
jgi:hypothetical protein